MPFANPDARREYVRRYKARNREKIRKYNQEWRRRKVAEDPEFRGRSLIAQKVYRQRHPDKLRANNERGRKEFAVAIRNSNLKALYGITVEEYNRILKEQDCVCAICGSEKPGANKRYLSVDHDHGSHTVRGLLCDDCNNGLGRFKDDPTRLRKAVAYLESRASNDG